MAPKKPGNPWNQFPKKAKPKPSKRPRVQSSKALPPGQKGGAVTKPKGNSQSGSGKPTNALPPGSKGGALAKTSGKPQSNRGALATQGRGPLGGQRALPPGVRGGPVERAGPTIDVEARPVSSSRGGGGSSRPGTRALSGSSTPRPSRGSTSNPSNGSTPRAISGSTSKPSNGSTPNPSSGPRGVGSRMPNSERYGFNLPRSGAAALRSRIADVRPAPPKVSKPSTSAQTTPTAAAKPSVKPAAKPAPKAAAKPSFGGGARSAAGRLGKIGLGSVALTAIVGKAADTLGKAADIKEWERVQRELKQRQANSKAPKPQTAKPGQKGAVSPQQSAKTKAETVGSNKPSGTTGGQNKRSEYKRPASTAKTPSAAVQATDKRDKKKLF